MLRALQNKVWPQLSVTIRPDHLLVTEGSSLQSLGLSAPFSCSHMLVSDIDILEHAASKLFKQLLSKSAWCFPQVTILTDSRLHWLERKVIRDAMMNAGAQRVEFSDSILVCEEAAAARRAYIRQETAKR